MAGQQRLPRSKGPYTTVRVTSETDRHFVKDLATGATSRFYSLQEASYLRDWLAVRAMGYPLEQRRPVYR